MAESVKSSIASRQISDLNVAGSDPPASTKQLQPIMSDMSAEYNELEELKRQIEAQQQVIRRLRENASKRQDALGGENELPGKSSIGHEKSRAGRTSTSVVYSPCSSRMYRNTGQYLNLSDSEWSERDSDASWEAKRAGSKLTVNADQGDMRAYLRFMALPETGKVIALGKLKKLRKSKTQSVAEYCVELERLSAKAYPELDAKAIDITRAQQLYEQVVHWHESYYFMEAMEEGGDQAYARLKEVVMRVERRRLMLESAKETNQRLEDGKLFHNGRGTSESRDAPNLPHSKRVYGGMKKGSAPLSSKTEEALQVKRATESNGRRCYICKSTMHLAKDCAKRPELGSKSMEVSSEKGVQNAKRTYEVDKQKPSSYGRKSTTTVKIFGRKYTALLDTGSEISILPEIILRQLQSEGCRVIEQPVDPNRKVSDASGNRMKFLAVVEIPVAEGDNTEVFVRMHVVKHRRPVLVLGTNALPALGYTLVKALGNERIREDASQCEEKELEVVEANSTKAVLTRRVYVAPGEVKWIPVTGGPRCKERVFLSTAEWLHSGLCTLDDTGGAEVQVFNQGTETIVMRAGQEVGTWERDDPVYTKVVAKEVATDMLVLGWKMITMSTTKCIFCICVFDAMVSPFLQSMGDQDFLWIHAVAVEGLKCVICYPRYRHQQQRRKLSVCWKPPAC
ncbi:unnamed protein product [Nippostrongylus brasiliensis]|uniref:Peptidase A2 domain-containing protein n=1 Tax=Nippostrongylus brasiliensis TaxID=27835 RepID=A0A0N4XGA4_NIPBR|nr:unnamed protein product [Nippostrongylus brasiliensis]